MKINVKYFAIIRDNTGIEGEVIETQAKDSSELYDFLSEKYPLTLKQSDLRVAINNSFKSFKTLLKDNDVVAFIPPVAGG